MFTTCLLNSKLGVNGMFFVLGIVQAFAFGILYAFMRETQGLSASEKKNLYAHSDNNESFLDHEKAT